MSGMGDVVRRVILKVIVDADGLAADMAKARAELKGLDDATTKSARDRAAAEDLVTAARQRQNKALKENDEVSKKLGERQVDDAKKIAEAHKASAKATEQQTQAQIKAAQAQEKLTQDQEKHQQSLLRKEQELKKVKDANDVEHLRALEKLDAEITANAERARQQAIVTAKAQQTADDEVAANRRRIDDEEVARAVKRSEQRQRDNEREKESLKLRQKAAEEANKRKDVDTAAKNSRLDENAENSRQVVRERAAAAARAQAEKDATSLAAHELATEDKLYTQASTNEEKLRHQRERNTTDEFAHQQNLAQRVAAESARISDGLRQSSARVRTSEASAVRSEASARDTSDRSSVNAISRRVKAVEAIKSGEEKIATLVARRSDAEGRLAHNEEMRARQRQRAATQKPTSVGGAVREFVGIGQGLARSFVDNFTPSDTERIGKWTNALRSAKREANDTKGHMRGLAGGLAVVGGAFQGFVHNFKSIDVPTEKIGKFRNAMRGLSEETASLKGSGGSGGIIGFFGAIGSAAGDMANGVTSAASGMTRNFFTMKGLILLVVAALGPLIAMLGALGAAAIAAGNTLVGLAGSLVALPGLIAAAALGIGALMVAIKPLGDVFDAYQKKQQAAAQASSKFGTAQQDAARKLQDARRDMEDAQRGMTRALQDQKRAEEDLGKSRRDAARNIQDYRMALQKLKFDQEGAALGVESAEQEYRRALADPTKNNLDRKIARHNVQGAMFDQRDQTVAAGRTRQDANDAEKRGVEGAPAVVSARRAIEDAEWALSGAVIRQKRAREDLTLAEKESKAGGPAALKAQQEYERLLATLSPSTRKFAEHVLGLGGAWKKLQKNVSEALFGPIVTHLGQIDKLLDPLESMLSKAAGAMGKFAGKALDLFTNSDWKAFFNQQGDQAASILSSFGDAVLYVADGLRTFMSNKDVIQFTKDVASFASSAALAFASWTKSTDSKGKSGISDFIGIVRKRLKEVWDIIGPLVRGFKDFFFATSDFTGKFNEGLAGAARHFEDLGKKAGDKNGGFQKWLTDVWPLLQDIGTFIGQIVTSFAQMASDPKNISEARKILKELSETILPAIVDIFHELSESEAFSKLVSAIGSVAKAFDSFLKHGGTEALSTFADWIKGIGTTIDWISTHVPGAASAVGILAGALAVLAGVSLFSKFTGLLKVFQLIGSIRDITKGSGGFVAGLKTLMQATWDGILGRDKNVAANNRNTKNNGGIPGAGTAPGTGGVLPHLSRIEGYLQTIIRLLGGNPGPGGFDPSNPTGPGGGPGGKHRKPEEGGRHSKPGSAANIGEEVIEDTLPGARPGGVKRPGRFGRGVRGGAKAVGIAAAMTAAFALFDSFTNPAKADDGSDTEDSGGGFGFGDMALTAAAFAIPGLALPGMRGNRDKDQNNQVDPSQLDPSSFTGKRSARPPARHARPSARPARLPAMPATPVLPTVEPPAVRPSWFSRLFSGGGARAAESTAVRGARFAGLTNPFTLAGTAVGIAADVGFKDRKSTAAQSARATGAILTGAGIGTEILPGWGTAIGAAAGAGYSLVKDKGLRDKIGGGLKNAAVATGGAIKTAATAVGGAVQGAGEGIGRAWDGGYEGFMKNVGSPISTFFTKTLPRSVSNFFTKTLPSLPGRAFDAITTGAGRVLGFFSHTLPRMTIQLFTKTIPHAASTAWKWVTTNLVDPFVEFITVSIPNFFTKTVPKWFSSARRWFTTHVTQPVSHFISGIPDFFTKTIPKWFHTARHWVNQHVRKPVHDFISGIPDFFTRTIPKWFHEAPTYIRKHIIDPLTNFFTKTLPDFFTKTIPDAIGKLPGWIRGTLVQPVLDFFSGMRDHVSDFLHGRWDWVRKVFDRGAKNVATGADSMKHSGGVIEGTYDGRVDTVRLLATVGEHVTRKRVVDKPYAKQLLGDLNEERLNPADFYAALSFASRPSVHAMAAPSAVLSPSVVGGAVITNNTRGGLSTGDIIINNPVREKAEHSMRRALHTTAFRLNR